MGNKSLEYRQITIRIPTKLFALIEDMSKQLGTTIQDTILIILVDYLVFERD